MDDFTLWFNNNYPDHVLSIESLDFIGEDLIQRFNGESNPQHWVWTYLNGNRQFVFRVVDEYIEYRRCNG